MNQPVTALKGAGSLLDLGTPAVAGASALPDGSGQGASFDVMIAKAASGQKVETGNSVPQDGEKLPTAPVAAEEGAEDLASEAAVGNAGHGAITGEASQTVEVKVTPEMISEYRKADISVAVSSIMQQYSMGKGEPVPAQSAQVVAVDSSSRVVSSAVPGINSPGLQNGGVNTVAPPSQRGGTGILPDAAADRNAQKGTVEQPVTSEAAEKVVQTLAGTPPDRSIAPSNAGSDTASAASTQTVSSENAVNIPVPERSVEGVVDGGGQNSAEGVVGQSDPVVSEEQLSGVASQKDVAQTAVGDSSGEVQSASGGQSQPAQVPQSPAQSVEQTRDPNASVSQAQSPSVLQAVADKLKDQVRPGADAARSVAAEAVATAVDKGAARSGAETQPIIRETAQVVGDLRTESAKAVGPLEGGAELRGEIRGREAALNTVSASVADSSSGAKPEASVVDKSLTGFAESLAMATKTSKSVAEAQQMVMPNGLKPGAPAWNQAVNDRVMLLSSQNGRFAEIQLDPPELGSLQVKLQVRNEQVSVVFSTPHAVVKDALEQGMPRLREMFEQQGMSLADSSVEDHGTGQQSEGDSERGFGQSQGVVAGNDSEGESSEVVNAQSVSLVDYYA